MGGWNNPEVIGLYERFCHAIFEAYKDDVRCWLTFNVLNTTLFGRFCIPDIPDEAVRPMYIKLHHQLVASAKVVKYAHEHYPSFTMGCMLAAMTNYPLTCNPKDILATQEKTRDSFWYCGDVQARGAYPACARRTWREFGLDAEYFLKDEETLREGNGSMDRYRKDSFWWYAKCIRSNGEDLD